MSNDWIDFSFNGKSVGRIKGTKYFTIRKPNMYFIKYKGFGISEQLLQSLYRRGIATIIVRYEGIRKIKTLQCSIAKFLNSTKTHWYNNQDPQRFVSERDFELLGEEDANDRRNIKGTF